MPFECHKRSNIYKTMEEQEPLQNGHVPGKSGKRRKKKKQRLPEDEEVEAVEEQQLSPIEVATYEVCKLCIH